MSGQIVNSTFEKIRLFLSLEKLKDMRLIHGKIDIIVRIAREILCWGVERSFR